ncbi:MAG: DapH/DapD/GlmU-related protein [Clostridia bacterium]
MNIDITTEKRMEIIEKHIQNGVVIPCVDGIIIDEASTIGAKTVILPGCIILNSNIGVDCVIGPNSYVEKSKFDDNISFKASFCNESSVGSGTTIGPFCQLRPNTCLGRNIKIGDFVEVKNSNIADRTAIAHLTYIGDSDVGERVNFGCGTVTSNYDGNIKSRTVIGNDVFIGCNTNFIAPVVVEDDSYIAAGSTITDTVPSNSLAIARSRQENKIDWKKKKKK